MRFLLSTLFALVFSPSFSQEIRITYSNKDTLSDEAPSLLFKRFDNLGIESPMSIRGSASLKVQDGDAQLFYISSFMSGGILCLNAGDSISVIRKSGGILKYSGSKEIEHNLVEFLYANDLQGYGPIKGDVQALSMKRLIPYMDNKMTKLNTLITEYLKENPGIDLAILEVIKNETKFNYLKEAIRKTINSTYNDIDYENLVSLLENNGLETLQNLKFRNGFITNIYQKEYLDFLYCKKYKEAILSLDNRNYYQQLQKRFKFYLEFEDPVREEVYFTSLRNFFDLKSWGNAPVEDYTKDYLMFSKNEERKEFIKKQERKILSLQNSELQARLILSDTLLQQQLLLKPDGSEIHFGQLLDSLNYKWVFLDAWATWCAPCRAEMNKLNAEIIQKMNTKVVFFSIDDDIEKWKDVVSRHYSFEGKVDHYRLDKDSILSRKLFGDAISIPQYFLFNVSRNRFYHNVSKPTKFNLDDELK